MNKPVISVTFSHLKIGSLLTDGGIPDMHEQSINATVGPRLLVSSELVRTGLVLRITHQRGMILWDTWTSVNLFALQMLRLPTLFSILPQSSYNHCR